MKKIHISSLGCAKNLVDSEVLAGQLHNRKYVMAEQADDADVIIVNTCGFITPAKQESIQAIFEAVALKKKNPHKQIFVSGCLSQRYRDELKNNGLAYDETIKTNKRGPDIKLLEITPKGYQHLREIGITDRRKGRGGTKHIYYQHFLCLFYILRL